MAGDAAVDRHVVIVGGPADGQATGLDHVVPDSPVRVGDAGRTRALRHRYLVLHLDALRPHGPLTRLPGRPPSSEELAERWAPRLASGTLGRSG